MPPSLSPRTFWWPMALAFVFGVLLVGYDLLRYLVSVFKLNDSLAMSLDRLPYLSASTSASILLAIGTATLAYAAFVQAIANTRAADLAADHVEMARGQVEITTQLVQQTKNLHAEAVRQAETAAKARLDSIKPLLEVRVYRSHTGNTAEAESFGPVRRNVWNLGFPTIAKAPP
jgi:hypothetical protein